MFREQRPHQRGLLALVAGIALVSDQSAIALPKIPAPARPASPVISQAIEQARTCYSDANRTLTPLFKSLPSSDHNLVSVMKYVEARDRLYSCIKELSERRSLASASADISALENEISIQQFNYLSQESFEHEEIRKAVTFRNNMPSIR